MKPPSPGSEDRLTAARAGSREALGDLLEAYRLYLLKVARDLMDPRLAAKAGASDIVQETFSDAQRDFAQFEGATEAEFQAWLRQVLVHHVFRFARDYKGTQKRAAGREVPFSGGSGEDDDGTLDVPAVGPTPSGQLLAAERDEALEAAIARLPDDSRRVLLLKYRQGLSFEEIGQLVGRSAEAARKIWARAVERLHAELEEH